MMSNPVFPYDLILGWLLMVVGFWISVFYATGIGLTLASGFLAVFFGGFLVGQADS